MGMPDYTKEQIITLVTRQKDLLDMLADLRENRDVAVDALEAAIADLEFMGAKESARIHRMTLNNVKLMDDQLERFNANT